MAGGAPGASSRGRGGKFKKFTRHPLSQSRHGGKHFSRNLRPLDADGNEVGMWGDAANKRESDEEDDSEEESSEEESEDEAGPSASKQPSSAELSREERRKEKKARKDAAIAKTKKVVQVGDLPSSDSEEESDAAPAAMPANPNHSRQARAQTKKPAAGIDEATEGVAKMNVAPSRREREALEAAAAKERYRKLHEAGKTEEAKADLARLRLIREKREAEAARKQAEKEEKEAHDKEKRAEIEAREAKRREAAMGPSSKKNKKK
ncbi:hypothetical protein N0V88_005595 [Collariella sp. IMI 366227]|nr:hypothetical protein N0V88_005595 [Collariella sp. IMI 366227]